MIKIQLLIFAFFTITSFGISQNTNNDASNALPPPTDEYIRRSEFGIFADINFNQHFVDFRALPETPCCGNNFTIGNGIGPSLGVLYSLPLYKRLFLELRLGFHSRDGKFKKEESTINLNGEVIPMKANLNGEAVPVTFEQSIDSRLHSIALEPILGYNIWKGLNLLLGFHAGLMVTKSFFQQETIIEPSTGVFVENNSRTRMPKSGAIPNAYSSEASVLGGISYDIPLTEKKTWIISPEAYYHYGLTSVISGNKWNINQVRLGIAVKYSPYVEPRHIKEVIPPPKENQPMLSAKVSAFGVNPDSAVAPVVQFRVEEFLSTQMRPLLTYVFFDDNSSEIPKRYLKLSSAETWNFTVEKLHNWGTLETYYHVLNIIGKRMKDNPTAKITLEGCNSGTGSEKNNIQLSKDRANAVRDYFLNVWNIEPDRLVLTQRNIPQEPSNVYEADGVVENRRVEITSNKWEIVEPIQIDDTLRMVSPPIVRFESEAKSEAGLSNWSLTASQNNSQLKNFSGDGDVPKSTEWRFDKDEKSIPRQSVPLDFSLKVTDKTGQAFETQKQSIPVELITIQKKRRERIADKYIERYSLIMFSFDKSFLTYNNTKVVELIKSRLKPGSELKVVGHTDRMGNESYNLHLSQDRAATVSNSFKNYPVTSKGFGELEQLYDNDLPEGRFYCRKVDVVVETPVE